mmetsp:Transcript_29554/g.34160  ORF Transcript_29554/g.34160 Transcript_29554/m.34160 type:complete len:117 (+) Transcript_29554:62-412(+)|eukprot:CAMPEP_0176441448 /NCGR_PEP_ID=MMETSP0127-20121128/21201_1 /TAXON_ID=938130 /ORGANISM="Platyophrya macrostoma, Strain WH" /LENGTH=116 /DNA_ID=CAMNT_0017826223 /DNA_START=62 /DNA_END=412 /DNA_ORIENTATION=+
MTSQETSKRVRIDALGRFFKLAGHKNSSGRVDPEDYQAVTNNLQGIAFGSTVTTLAVVPATTFLVSRAPLGLGSTSKLIGGIAAGFCLSALISDMMYGSRVAKATEVLKKYPELLE